MLAFSLRNCLFLVLIGYSAAPCPNNCDCTPKAIICSDVMLFPSDFYQIARHHSIRLGSVIFASRALPLRSVLCPRWSLEFVTLKRLRDCRMFHIIARLCGQSVQCFSEARRKNSPGPKKSHSSPLPSYTTNPQTSEGTPLPTSTTQGTLSGTQGPRPTTTSKAYTLPGVAPLPTSTTQGTLSGTQGPRPTTTSKAFTLPGIPPYKGGGKDLNTSDATITNAYYTSEKAQFSPESGVRSPPSEPSTTLPPRSKAKSLIDLKIVVGVSIVGGILVIALGAALYIKRRGQEGESAPRTTDIAMDEIPRFISVPDVFTEIPL